MAGLLMLSPSCRRPFSRQPTVARSSRRVHFPATGGVSDRTHLPGDERTPSVAAQVTSALRFEWDAPKAASHGKKHRVSFDEAVSVLSCAMVSGVKRCV